MTVSRNAPGAVCILGVAAHRQNNDNRADQSRVEPESVPMLQNTTQSNFTAGTEAKQIDYNDSIRSTYSRSTTASHAARASPNTALPLCRASSFRISRPPSGEREGNPARLPGDRSRRGSRRSINACSRIGCSTTTTVVEEASRRYGGTFHAVLPATADALGLRNRHPAHDGPCLALRCPYPQYRHAESITRGWWGASRSTRPSRSGELWALPSICVSSSSTI